MMIIWDSYDIQIYYEKGDWYILYKHIEETVPFECVADALDSIRFELRKSYD